MIITIDGPAGSGKSTAARGLASRLGFQFLDTGAMYRAVAWACLRDRIDLQDLDAVVRLAQSLRIDLDGERIWVDSFDVSQEIRTMQVSQATSIVAANPLVRNLMVSLQRHFASGKNVVTEGRDQGTVVFPHAEFKFYLVADPEERAKRRLAELQSHGGQITLEEILFQQQERDERDQRRSHAPLRCAPDAIPVNTTRMSTDQVLNLMQEIVLRDGMSPVRIDPVS